MNFDNVAADPRRSVAYPAMIRNTPMTEPVDLARLHPEQLQTMLKAGEEILECRRVLAKAGLNLVGEVLRGQGTFYQYNHYPEGDVYDRDSHSQYYYHAHRGVDGEHGHFHTFLRYGGLPGDATPIRRFDGAGMTTDHPRSDDEPAHLIALSMDAYGWPIGLFTTNRWVTNQTWYSVDDTVRMLDRFLVDHAYPSWPVNRWISAMFRLFRPQIVELLYQRDRTIMDWVDAHPDRDVFEDRELEVTSAARIDVELQIEAIKKTKPPNVATRRRFPAPAP